MDEFDWIGCGKRERKCVWERVWKRQNDTPEKYSLFVRNLGTWRIWLPPGTKYPRSATDLGTWLTYLSIGKKKNLVGWIWEASKSGPRFHPVLYFTPRFHPAPDFTLAQIFPCPRFHPAPDFPPPLISPRSRFHLAPDIQMSPRSRFNPAPDLT